MERKRCISYGYIIMKGALHDPHVCKDCEHENKLIVELELSHELYHEE